MSKFKTSRYYIQEQLDRVYKCIDEEENVYFFKRVDGKSYGISKCCNYKESSRLCKKCTNKTVCSKWEYVRDIKEIPYLKAILLYG